MHLSMNMKEVAPPPSGLQTSEPSALCSPSFQLSQDSWITTLLEIRPTLTKGPTNGGTHSPSCMAVDLSKSWQSTNPFGVVHLSNGQSFTEPCSSVTSGERSPGKISTHVPWFGYSIGTDPSSILDGDYSLAQFVVANLWAVFGDSPLSEAAGELRELEFVLRETVEMRYTKRLRNRDWSFWNFRNGLPGDPPRPIPGVPGTTPPVFIIYGSVIDERGPGLPRRAQRPHIPLSSRLLIRFVRCQETLTSIINGTVPRKRHRAIRSLFHGGHMVMGEGMNVLMMPPLGISHFHVCHAISEHGVSRAEK
ncbi:hypothetical protein B0T20DRAFT_396022 [Sordaria brevicollis]|uniref:Uncharacterized protein n=1 Tax=Sordaria brevicollis TaxID=83679 RepID=A0AAE0P2S9_SORBR|nr:hypothetical protein B0T20DRAFT_396022 [Sordaria brevicollis]